MTFENFKKVLDNIRAFDTFTSKLLELGVDVFNAEACVSVDWNNKFFFTEIYGKEGYDWISWYLYEWPHFQEEIKKNGDKKEYHAWDENGELLDLSTDEKLWKMLEDEYAVGKKYHD